MRTSSYSNAKQGDVIAVQSIHGRTMRHVIVTDTQATGHTRKGGYECREATDEEVEQATKERRVRHEYNG